MLYVALTAINGGAYGMSSSRRKSIGRGDEASGPVMNARASESMARGESVEQLEQQRYGKPVIGAYARRLGGEYGSSVRDLS